MTRNGRLILKLSSECFSPGGRGDLIGKIITPANPCRVALNEVEGMRENGILIQELLWRERYARRGVIYTV